MTADAEPVVGVPAPPPVAAPEPRRLHPLTPVFDLFDRQLVAPAIVAVGSGGLRLLVAGLVAYALVRAVAWSRRTYVLDGGVLRVDSGVLGRNQQLVPSDRIQQVGVVRTLRHRLLGLASLRVEVAGGGRGSGVELEVLGVADAGALRDALLAAKADAPAARASAAGGEPTAPSEGQGGVPVVRVSYRQLVVAGLTGSELLVVFALLASATQVVEDVPDRLRDAVAGVELGGGLTVALVAAFVVVWLGAAVATAVLRDARYALDLVGDELHLARGLLDRREAVLPLARVQAVRVTASPLRRPLGYVSLRVLSASAGSDQEERRVSVPLLPVAQVPAVVSLLLPGSASVPSLAPAAPVARRRAVVRAMAPVAVAGAVAAPVAPGLALAALALLPAAAGFGLLAYRGLGHAVGPSHLTTRSGALVRRTVVVPLARTQSARVRASPFQRRLGIATCVVDVAGPGRAPAVVDVARPTAEAVAGRAVAAVGGR